MGTALLTCRVSEDKIKDRDLIMLKKDVSEEDSDESLLGLSYCSALIRADNPTKNIASVLQNNK